MSMTPDAKKHLSSTIRALRARLLEELSEATRARYQLKVRLQDAALSEADRTSRRRLEAWVAEQARSEGDAERHHADAVKQAAYTLLNRLVFLRLLEARSIRSPAVLTGGWESPGYRDFRELAPALVKGDATEGYAFLLRLVFEDLAVELPGLFGPAGVAELIVVPPSTLRHVVEALDDEALASCWTDDLTLGWIYQYWNDPEREGLDKKLNEGGKVEAHEIASKTQMFTERYMVDWLLQNSLGPMWLAMCKKHGWTPEAEADGTLDGLEARRVEWRAKREAGEVELTELMPLHSDAERRWAYYVPQPIPEDAVTSAPDSVRALKILDPAVGSGHFLVVAFDLLFALYREEARHRGVTDDDLWTDDAIAEHILEANLHGIDLDPRAVQIAAAALWLKARERAPGARPRTLNLVASNLRLSSLKADDPALVELRAEVNKEIGVPGALVDTLVAALAGADHLGSLLKVDHAVEEALDAHEAAFGRQPKTQGKLFGGFEDEQLDLIEKDVARVSLVDRLERFLAAHSGADDLGLRLRGEQLARGVRFVRMVQEGRYDVVVGNPPYQGTSKMADAKYVKKKYPRGKADLFAAFLERGLELVRDGGTSALLTMRNWMFIKQYAELRMHLLKTFDLRGLGDFDRGAFEEVPDEVVSVVVSVFRRAAPVPVPSIALQPTPLDDRTRDGERTRRKRAATRCQVGGYEFHQEAFDAILHQPIVYWYEAAYLDHYRRSPKLGEVLETRVGVRTSNNTRFIRLPWEVSRERICVATFEDAAPPSDAWFVPHVMGGAGRDWMEPIAQVINWRHRGLEVCVTLERAYGAYPQSTEFYFQPAIALPKIGLSIRARVLRYRSVIDCAAPCVFPVNAAESLCLLKSAKTAEFLRSINPTMNLQPGDLDRIPIFEAPGSAGILRTMEHIFAEHERHREPSLEFSHPGPSKWEAAQDWGRIMVNSAVLDAFDEPDLEAQKEPVSSHISYRFGICLGRFPEPGTEFADNSILLVDGSSDRISGAPKKLVASLSAEIRRAGLGHSETNDYLRTRFFAEVHRPMYENRPIYWPLSSAKKSFVAYVNIHRMNVDTLRVLLADHLQPALQRLDGEHADLLVAKESGDKKARREAERRFVKVQKWREELAEFIANVEQCAEKGPPPTDPKCPEREVDARYDPDLDDGVMINSAALWPLLEPQWKDPKKWYKQLATAKGKKDYDWAHLAMRYWPTRVDAKCQEDPSLGVAHGCFWRYHPARAWAWELRLQDEIGPDFRIEEAPYRGDGGDAAHRDKYLAEHPDEAIEAVEKEVLRRKRKKKAPQPELTLLEPGLWTARPERCFQLEIELTEKQQVEFRLNAPDADAVRDAYVAAHPEQEAKRKAIVAKLTPPEELFDGEQEAS